MAKKPRYERHVQKTGNALRTFLIWAGIVLVLVAALIEYFWPGNERVVLYVLMVVGLAYGAALLDFDTDDDD
jgi:hypothetical protein